MDKYNALNIFTPKVAEIENLFLIPELIKHIAKKQNKSDKVEEILSTVKIKTIEFLVQEKDAQALLFTKL